jgi:two-component system LytT family response regulator
VNAPATPLRAVIVDDEPLARRVLREYLAAHAEIEVVAECENGFEAVRAVTECAPDLLFLDVQMPKLDGFEVLELIDPRPAVIFVTAYDQYALKAFDVHAVDYLLKPFPPERLAEALQRARLRVGQGVGVAPGQLAASARPAGTSADRILVREGALVTVVPVDQLDYAEAQDDYVCLHVGKKQHLKTQTLGDLEARLDPARFVRIHRSYLLNLDRLARLELDAKESRIAILRDGAQLPVSRTGYQRLRERM